MRGDGHTPSVKLVAGRTIHKTLLFAGLAQFSLLFVFSGVQCIAVKLKHGRPGIQTVAFWWSNVVD